MTKTNNETPIADGIRACWQPMSGTYAADLDEIAAIARLEASHADLLAELESTREWVAQYLGLPGHHDAAMTRLAKIDAALAKTTA